LPNKPVIAGYVTDDISDLPDIVKEAIGEEINSPVKWAIKNVEEYGVDLISLKLLGADPSKKNTSPSECAKLVKDILEAVDVPLIIWGCGDDEKDSLVLPDCSSAARGENCLIGSAKESNYKTLVAICKADNIN
jgi:acetyl-CoA decarbonylase/synthase complex subunit delta